MKISQNTIAILSNFAKINPNILITQGNAIKTISEGRSILAKTTVEETFPSEFGVYDLNEFLSALSLLRDADVEFEQDNLALSQGKNSIKYFYSQKDLLTYPTKDITMPPVDVSFTLTNEQLSQLKKASVTFGHDAVIADGENGVINLIVTDVNDATSNKYSIEVDDTNPCKEKFNMVFSINDLKLLPRDYIVEISSKAISHFKSTTDDLEYWIALDSNSSTFGE